MGVVGGGGDGDGPGAAHVGVAQLVGQLLQLVRVEVVIVPEHVVVARPRGALDTCTHAGVSIKACYLLLPIVYLHYFKIFLYKYKYAKNSRSGPTLMRAQVEVELRGVGDADVHGGAGGDVAALAALLLLVRAEEARVVPLLHHDEGDPRLVVSLELGRKYLDKQNRKNI